MKFGRVKAKRLYAALPHFRTSEAVTGDLCRGGARTTVVDVCTFASVTSAKMYTRVRNYSDGHKRSATLPFDTALSGPPRNTANSILTRYVSSTRSDFAFPRVF